MCEPLALMQALLGPGIHSAQAEDALNAARSAGVDPLHWCAIHYGLDPAEITRRAAIWAGVAYRSDLPPAQSIVDLPPRIDRLADIRMVGHRTADGDIALVSPDFYGIIRLRRSLARNPQLAARLFLVPPAVLRDHLLEAATTPLIDHARQNLSRHWPNAAAHLDLIAIVRWGFAIGLLTVAVLVLVAPLFASPWFIPLWMVVMGVPTLLRIAALATPTAPERPGKPIADRDLPLYSILLPLRDEANMVDQLAAHLRRLDYPAERLEIIFVVESRSPETIAAVQRHLADARFSLIVVPDAAPRTKPKALDFALPFCHGEFVVVFDAEDRPAPDQLRRIVAQFRQQRDVHCIQSRLVIGNGSAGGLTALFAGEYAGLFAVILPALARWHAVMPLGGTSNHFRLESLRRLGGWDAFNVTEDADLGVRLARRRLRTSTSTTVTLEDAPLTLRPWMGQRTRWLKGWMQTFMVHNRRPGQLLSDLGVKGFGLFELTIFGMLLAPLLHAACLPLLAVMYLLGHDPFASPWAFACWSMLTLGFGATICLNMVGLLRTGQHRLLLWQMLLPLYWLLITWAELRALRDFVRRPFHWFKTPHLVTETVSRSGKQRPALGAESDMRPLASRMVEG